MDEAQIIAKYFAPIADKSIGLGLKDDAAVLNKYIISTDLLIQNLHFFGTESAQDIARKALRINLSDIAAMGGVPKYYLMSLAIPNSTDEDWLHNFSTGLDFDNKEYRVKLIGGDLVICNAPITISITIFGECGNPIKTNTAQLGDNIYVTGNIGDSGLGLRILQGKLNAPAWAQRQLIASYQLPSPAVNIAPQIAKYANAMTDISDGLNIDLWQICKNSSLGAQLDSNTIPISNAANEVINSNQAKITDLLEYGDDYQLIFTAPADKHDDIMKCATINHNITKIGQIIDSPQLIIDNKEIKIKGYKPKLAG